MAQDCHCLDSIAIRSGEETIIMRNLGKRRRKEGEVVVEMMPIMGMIEDAFRRSLFTSEMVPEEIYQSIGTCSCIAKVTEMPETIRCTINRLSWEITCESSKGLDACAITQIILDSLEKFSWAEKGVLVLASFAKSYGEFWLSIPSAEIQQIPLFQSISMSQRFQFSCDSALASNFPFIALAFLVKSMLDLAHCMIQLDDYLQCQSEFQAACCLIINSAVSCQIYNMELVKLGTEYTASTTVIRKLETYTHEILSFHAALNERLERCFIIEEEEAFAICYKDVTFRMKKFFITEDALVLRHIYKSGDRIMTRKVGLDVLVCRCVALFITDFNFDVKLQVFSTLVETYKKIKEGNNKDEFEIVWIPMVDQSCHWSQTKEIYERADLMPWYSICDLTTIKASFKLYIRKSWNFHREPILVMLDKKGAVTCTNAIPMVTIWGDSAYPFTRLREATLWREMSWIETLIEGVKGIDSRILIKQGKLVCFYGGDDLNWIRKFAKEMMRVIRETGVLIELIYVGVNGRREKLQKILATFALECISSYWSEETVYSFWFRFQSMYNSMMQQCKSAAFKDSIMKELMTILTFDSTDHGWAIMFSGPNDIVTASGKQMVQFLERFESWVEKVHMSADFLRVAMEDISSNRSCEHSIHAIIPVAGWVDPGERSCLVCGNTMQRYYHYECCIQRK